MWIHLGVEWKVKMLSPGGSQAFMELQTSFLVPFSSEGLIMGSPITLSPKLAAGQEETIWKLTPIAISDQEQLGSIHSWPLAAI